MPMNRPTATSSTLVILVLLSLALLALRMFEFTLSGAGLHVDEAQYWLWSRDLQWGYFSKPPVLVALITASTALFGNSLLGVKALAMMCWILSAWVLGWLAYRINGMRTAIFAGGLFSATLVSGLLGLSVTTDAPLTLCWALCMLTLWEAAHAKGLRAHLWWIACGLSLGLGVLSKYSALALGISALWVLATAPQAQRRHIFSGGLLASLVAVLVLLPHLSWNIANHWPTAQHTLEITVQETGSTVAQGAGGWRRMLASGLEFSFGQLLILGPSVWLVCFWLWRKQRTHDLPPPDEYTPLQAQVWTPRAYAMAFSFPILALGLIQALNSKALINWSVPMALGVCLWLACWAHEQALSIKRFVWACLAGVVLSGFIATGGDIKQWVGVQTQPNQSKWDIWGRMRGWDNALQTLKPVLEPYRDVPWLTGDRSTLVQAAYSLRTLEPKLFAWNSDGSVHHHFEWKQPWPANATDPAVVWLNPGEPHPALLMRYPNASLLGEAKSGRITLQAWLLQTQNAKP
jgi:4-amino-4-deoxy-L-arabinose transferase-like glycosyltransferase